MPGGHSCQVDVPLQEFIPPSTPHFHPSAVPVPGSQQSCMIMHTKRARHAPLSQPWRGLAHRPAISRALHGQVETVLCCLVVAEAKILTIRMLCLFNRVLFPLKFLFVEGLARALVQVPEDPLPPTYTTIPRTCTLSHQRPKSPCHRTAHLPAHLSPCFRQITEWELPPF